MLSVNLFYLVIPAIGIVTKSGILSYTNGAKPHRQRHRCVFVTSPITRVQI